MCQRRLKFFILLSILFYPSGLLANANVSLSLWISEGFIQTFLGSEYHGQNVSTEEDQDFGFDQAQFHLKNQRAIVNTDFWYESNLTDRISGTIEVSFNMAYIPKKKRVKVTQGTIDSVKFKESPSFFLKPILEFAMKTALNNVAITSKLRRIEFSETVSAPIETVFVELVDTGVFSSVNEQNQVPKSLLKEAFVISVPTESMDSILQQITPEFFPESSTDTGSIVISQSPQFTLKSNEQESLQSMTLSFGLSWKQEDLSKPLGVWEVPVWPTLHGEGTRIRIRLIPQASLHSQENETALLKEYLQALESRLQNLEIALPPVQFIPKDQRLIPSQVHFSKNRLSLAGKLSSIPAQ